MFIFNKYLDINKNNNIDNFNWSLYLEEELGIKSNDDFSGLAKFLKLADEFDEIKEKEKKKKGFQYGKNYYYNNNNKLNFKNRKGWIPFNQRKKKMDMNEIVDRAAGYWPSFFLKGLLTKIEEWTDKRIFRNKFIKNFVIFNRFHFQRILFKTSFVLNQFKSRLRKYLLKRKIRSIIFNQRREKSEFIKKNFFKKIFFISKKKIFDTMQKFESDLNFKIKENYYSVNYPIKFKEKIFSIEKNINILLFNKDIDLLEKNNKYNILKIFKYVKLISIKDHRYNLFIYLFKFKKNYFFLNWFKIIIIMNSYINNVANIINYKYKFKKFNLIKKTIKNFLKENKNEMKFNLITNKSLNIWDSNGKKK